MDRALAAEFEAMLAADQAMRKSGHFDPDVDRRHAARLKEIVDAIGWPAISVVGVSAAHAAWLIAQHADLDRAFQKRCLELMRAAAPGEVSRHNLAYLEDRVLVGEGRPQRYGTQLRRGTDGRLAPLPVEEEEHVDERRVAMGMEPLAQYLAFAERSYSADRRKENR